MSSLQQRFSRFSITGNIPLPLWAQGMIEAAIVAFLLAIFAGIGPLLVYFGGGIAGAAPVDLGVWWSQSWLVLHAVPLNIHLADVAAASVGSLETPGTFHLWPITTIVLVILLSYRAGRRLSRTTDAEKFWQAALGAFLGYGLAATIAWSCSTQEASSTHWYTAILIPLLLFLLGFGAAALEQYYGIAALWERWCGARAAKFSQRTIWTFQYLWAGVRSTATALIALLGVAAAVFSIQLGTQWSEVVNLNQELNLGLSGAAAMAGINFMVLFNILIWTIAWLSGASVSLGQGSEIGMFGTAVGPVPAYPLFGMLPTTHQWWMWLLMLLPVLAGFLAGWWFIREGENHVDEALDVRVNQRWMSITLSTLTFGLMLAVMSWIVLVIVSWLSVIDLGVGRLQGLGPEPLTAALWTAGLCAAGGMLGYLLSPFINPFFVRLSEVFPEKESVAAEEKPGIISAERQIPVEDDFKA